MARKNTWNKWLRNSANPYGNCHYFINKRGKFCIFANGRGRQIPQKFLTPENIEKFERYSKRDNIEFYKNVRAASYG